MCRTCFVQYIRPHQLCWGEWEIETAILCTKNAARWLYNLIEMTVEVYQKLVSLHDKKMEQSLFVMYSAHQFNETGVITHTEVQ